MTACRSDFPQEIGLNRSRLSVAGTALILLAALAGGNALAAPSSDGFVRELRWGVAAHDVGGLWSGESCEEGPDILTGLIFNWPLFHLLSGTAYPELGFSINTRGHTSKIHGGLLLQWEPVGPVFFSTGIGLALHNGELETHRPDRKSLGSRLLFRVPIEIGIVIDRHHRLMIVFDHVSNADLAEPNEGMDTLGVMYGFHF
jgi:hypothetical protein